MTNTKEQIISIVNSLPDNISLDDAIYFLYLNSKLYKSELDIQNNNIMSIEESKERLKKKYENCDI